MAEGEAEGCCVTPQIICRGLRDSSGAAIRGWWKQHFGRKHCKLEAKGAHFSAQAVHFSHQCLLLFPASCQRHWCRHYPSSTAVIMLLANAWLKDLICKLSVQHLPTSSNALSLFSVSLTALEYEMFLSWTAANEVQGNILLLSILCQGEGVIAPADVLFKRKAWQRWI